MSPRKYSIKADFLEHQGRRLFYLLVQPTEGEVRGSVLYLPPFAEEMHKARYIVSCQARELAAVGYRVMLLDLTGCGDAGGDFADASWQFWLQDATFAANTLINLGSGPLTVWALRLGALLACDFSQSRSDIHKLVLWQPVLNGEQQVDQFLRIRMSASVVNNPFTLDRKMLWNELRAGRSLEIAGYELSSSMALQMAKARLNDFLPKCDVSWFEVGILPKNELPIASQNVIAHWREQGVRVNSAYVRGEPFWRIIDAVVNPSLQRHTLESFALS